MLIHKKALIKWGIESMLDILIEEMSEVIHAVCKFKRLRNFNSVTSNEFIHVCEEIGDAEIMIARFKDAYPESLDHISEFKTKKYERLRKKIEVERRNRKDV